ncbi:MAG: TraR/DksA family transcriptional regulator [Pseudodesulfovibrio sp.]|uniref:Transcriptional regulator, TraR/DksA family n=1 Tax=Pseudodesulfovibrio aespoeensis (strain ATCC 700646 / DSM 10631 / Aspo-2) TaxID=643562 RepID=E6W003_PSEA9|nr:MULTISPECIES: TraR/DksA C4-type zinc finger protein [Pseudodesulfovibrio]MBU4192524.1 TraR/DksA family transcriptional regulator [Pseudomonadota bacterium]ADU64085.1 transcriptional regulator, TraR/DksA family [Pseudodesulfovibrio aespoeensis Aspo-2]MBU4242858.1 TraR/DksA family transcriptional regulator [Pseudomonadota bacterium]MBU4379944.1 TraR/DksA family transcriptional regulator [Pseudomonadota bacterium]MBU4476007.1 TraR/DksA family transcriptional regulator [Pseudomonadota bacterium
MTETQRREIKDHLLNGLSSLTVQEAAETFAVENCPDETDFATQLAQQGVNLAMQRRRMARIKEYECAIKRLRETDYGTCDECGDPIGLARLKANPSARLCIVCQSAAEEEDHARCA